MLSKPVRIHTLIIVYDTNPYSITMEYKASSWCHALCTSARIGKKEENLSVLAHCQMFCCPELKLEVSSVLVLREELLLLGCVVY